MPLILHVPQHNLINKNNIELKVSHWTTEIVRPYLKWVVEKSL
jgi:hypothetical protein